MQRRRWTVDHPARTADWTPRINVAGGALRVSVTLVLCVAALFTIECCRKPPKAMDAVWTTNPDPNTNTIDDNGFALNPLWQQAIVSGPRPDPCAFCPCGNENPSAWE